MILSLLIRLQSYCFELKFYYLYNLIRRINKHYRTFRAVDVCQTPLGASNSNYFRVGIFFCQNTDLLIVGNDMLMELSNGIVRSKHLASLTLIQVHENILKNPLPDASLSTMLSLPNQYSRKQRNQWLRQQILANSIDIWLIIDSSSKFLENDLLVFLENSNQVVVLTDIPFNQKKRNTNIDINRSVYSIPDLVLISNADEFELWENMRFDNCLIRSAKVIDQMIDHYRNSSQLVIGATSSEQKH
ncbi:MAG: hypothetical protein QM538_03250 [Methylacidiphilales bacterium]|nr:hypothetical protein [Candidatus Methylacidiphilales bacterium]